MQYQNGFLLFSINKTGGLTRATKEYYTSTADALAAKNEVGTYIVMPCFFLDEPKQPGSFDTDTIAASFDLSLGLIQDYRIREYFNAVLSDSMNIADVPEAVRPHVIEEVVRIADEHMSGDRADQIRLQFDSIVSKFVTWLKSENGQKYFTEDNGAGEADTEG
jgi:hypothetical protein